MKCKDRIEVDAKTYWLFFFRAFLPRKQKATLMNRLLNILGNEEN